MVGCKVFSAYACDRQPHTQVAGGMLSSGSLDRFCSVALAGVATEYVRFGQAEGGINDIQQLDGLLRALQVTLPSLLRGRHICAA